MKEEELNKYHKELHGKYIIEIDGIEYCKKCDWGYLDKIQEGI